MNIQSRSCASVGRSGGGVVLGKLPEPGHPTSLDNSRQGPIALAVGIGGVVRTFFFFVYHFTFLSPSLWETARYRLKGPLGPKQPTNQLCI